MNKIKNFIEYIHYEIGILTAIGLSLFAAVLLALIIYVGALITTTLNSEGSVHQGSTSWYFQEVTNIEGDCIYFKTAYSENKTCGSYTVSYY